MKVYTAQTTEKGGWPYQGVKFLIMYSILLNLKRFEGTAVSLPKWCEILTLVKFSNASLVKAEKLSFMQDGEGAKRRSA